jgi:hypothetical protein
MWFPKYRCGYTASGFWSSFRWLAFGWDNLVYTDGTRFVQYGRAPVRFVLIKRPDAPVPKFLLNPFWKTTINKQRIKVGTTTRPIKIASLWRSYEVR